MHGLKGALLGAGAAVVALTWAGGAGATSPEYRQCVAQAGGAAGRLEDCAAAEGRKQDSALSTALQGALRRTSPAGRVQLKAQQEAWVKGRSAQCHAEIAPETGGSAAPVDATRCMLDEADKRIAALQAMGSAR